MTSRKVVLQPVVREKAAQLGDAGAAWLPGLPDLIGDLEQRWSITIGEWRGDCRAGDAGHVPPTARTPWSSWPSLTWTSPRQIQTLTVARGRGYVRLLAHDAKRYAALLEALWRR